MQKFEYSSINAIELKKFNYMFVNSIVFIEMYSHICIRKNHTTIYKNTGSKKENP